MEIFIYYLIGYLFGKYENKITEFINKQLFKKKYVTKKSEDFYDHELKNTDFEV